jgi:hypothetical protein
VTQDRDSAFSYIPSECRSEIMNLVKLGCYELVHLIAPNVIYRVTKSANLAPKILAKHNLLTAVLENLGYEIVDAGTDRFGRWFWLMGRTRD